MLNQWQSERNKSYKFQPLFLTLGMGGDSEERELEMAIQLSNSAIQNQVGRNS